MKNALSMCQWPPSQSSLGTWRGLCVSLVTPTQQMIDGSKDQEQMMFHVYQGFGCWKLLFERGQQYLEIGEVFAQLLRGELEFLR